MEIKIKTHTGTLYWYSVEDEATIRDLKYWMLEKTGINVIQQRYVYCGRLLSDDMSIKNLPNATTGIIIHMILSIRGG